MARIYSPDDGRALGLQGMINDLLERCAEVDKSEAASPPIEDLIEDLPAPQARRDRATHHPR